MNGQPPEQQQQPQAPRLPNITPEIFGQLNMLDGFIGKAPLSRAEHGQAQMAFQTILRHVEGIEGQLRQATLALAELDKLKAEFADLKAKVAAPELPLKDENKIVDAAIKHAYDGGKK